jgi:hypothetical protein
MSKSIWDIGQRVKVTHGYWKGSVGVVVGIYPEDMAPIVVRLDGVGYSFVPDVLRVCR